MAGYFLVDIEWTDPEGRARYVEAVGDTVASYDGKFLASVPEVRVLEGESPVKNRLVLLRFPTAERALEWYAEQQAQLHPADEGRDRHLSALRRALRRVSAAIRRP